MTTRRQFFALFGIGSIAAPVVAAEAPSLVSRLIGWANRAPVRRSANRLLSSQELSQEILDALTPNLAFLNQVDRQYDHLFAGRKIGDTIEIRRPPRFTSEGWREQPSEFRIIGPEGKLL